jgi:hypothetical protein
MTGALITYGLLTVAYLGGALLIADRVRQTVPFMLVCGAWALGLIALGLALP